MVEHEMTDQDYILKAVKLIGWEFDDEGWLWLYPPRDEMWGSRPSHVHWSWKWVQDIIAARLVRQYLLVINAPGDATFETDGDAMNTVKDIVDSKALE